MARSLSNGKMFSAYFDNGIAKAFLRRGYAAAAAKAARREMEVFKAVNGRSNGTVKMRSIVAKEEKARMPDPKTRFYRPEIRKDEIARSHTGVTCDPVVHEKQQGSL